LQVAPSFLGDFLEFVSNAAIEYRSARGHTIRCRRLPLVRAILGASAQIIGKCPKMPMHAPS
jgi:hypothetical protein